MDDERIKEDLNTLMDIYRQLIPLVERETDVSSDQLDESVQRLFPKSPPNWLSNLNIFGPLILSFSSRVEKLTNDIQEKQLDLKSLLREKKKSDKHLDQKQYDRIIADLIEEIKGLEMFIENNSMSSLSQINGENINSINEIQQKLAQLQITYNQKQMILASLEKHIKEANDEINQSKVTNQMFKNQLDTSEKTLKNYEKILIQLKATAKELNKSRQQQFKRGQNLSALITQYQLNKTNREKEIRKLEEQFADHQQLVVSYKMLEDQIKEQGKLQEIALNKMVDAVELTESAAAESQKNRMTRDNYADELKRLKDLIVSTTKQFEISFSEHEKSVCKHLESVLKSINERSLILESENSQFHHDKESIQRHIETASQENSILKALKSDNGFSLFVERMSALKAEIEAAYGKKEQLIAMNERSKDNIDDLKTRLVTNSTNTRNDTLELTQRSQKLELELEMHKSTCKELMEKNAKFTAENQKLRNEIVQVQRSASNEAQARLNEKDNELAEIKIQFEETSKANQKAITEMQQAVLAFQQHADKWKCKAQSIGLEASDAKQDAEGKQQQLIDQINDLESALAERKQLKAKAEFMLQQMDQQIKSLKQQISASEKKQKELSNTIQQNLTKQNIMSSEINKDKTLLDKLNVQVKRGQRSIDNMQALSNNDLDFSDI